MEVLVSYKPLLSVLLPLVAAVLIIALHKRPNLRDAVSVLASLLTFALVISMAPQVLANQTLVCHLYTLLPGVSFRFQADPLAMIFASIASLLWIATSLYSIGYMRSLKEDQQTRFFACFAFSLGAALGGAFSASLFTLVIFYEALTLITYPLVYHKETPQAWAGSKTYLVYLLGASKTVLLVALALTYQITGSLDFQPGGMFTGTDAAPWLLAIIYFCFMAGFAKAAIMPLHIWLPTAMVAPTPVSALLHAVAVVKMGVFCILRLIFFVIGSDTMAELGLGTSTAYLASFTIITASIYALTRDDLKARLAYSTVSQLSYIVLGAALLSGNAVTGGILHMASHAFAKITLFFCAGSIYCASQKKKISELAGIARHLPITMTAFFIGTLGMIGVPPAAGFISKWHLMLGTLEAGELAFLAVLVVSSLLNAAYFLPICYKAFFETWPASDHQHIKEDPWLTLPLLATALGSLLLGVYPDYFLTLARGVAL